MISAWIGSAIVLGAPAVLGAVYVAGDLWRGSCTSASEEDERRARRVVGVSAVFLAGLLVLLAQPSMRTLISGGVIDPSWDRVRRGAIAWSILYLGLALPYAALSLSFVGGRLSARLRGMVAVLSWLPVGVVGLALAYPACWGTPLILCGGLLGPLLAPLLLGPPAWLAVAGRVLARVPTEEAPRRASGARATVVWTAGIVTAALVMSAWEPRYPAPTPPDGWRLPDGGVPTAAPVWTAQVGAGDIGRCRARSSPPAVDDAGTIHVGLWDRVVAVSREGELMWERTDLRAGKALRARPGGGVYVVTEGVLEEGQPRSARGTRQLLEVLPDGSTGRGWPYVQTPLPRPDGGFYSSTYDHVVAVGPDGNEEWRTPLPDNRRSRGGPFFDAAGNILVPSSGDRVLVVTPHGAVAGTLLEIDTEPPQSWMPGPYPAPGPGGSLVSWDGDLIAVRPTLDTVWRREGYEPRVAAARDGSLRAIRAIDRGQIFLVRLDTLGLPTWRYPLVPEDPGWSWVSGGPVVGEGGATLLVLGGRDGRAIAIENDGTLRWISEPLPGVDVEHAVAWGGGGRAYVVRKSHEGGACAALVALEPRAR